MGIDVDAQPDKGAEYLNSLSQYVNHSSIQPENHILLKKFIYLISIVQNL